MQEARQVKWRIPIDWRGIRKIAIATMFITIAALYIGQLSKWKILPAGNEFASTPLSTVLAACAGAYYLWRIRIPHAIEITIIAIIGAHILEALMMQMVYSYLLDFSYDYRQIWPIISYTLYALILFAAYCLSYAFFIGWRTHYRNKLIVAGLFIIAAVIFQTMQGKS